MDLKISYYSEDVDAYDDMGRQYYCFNHAVSEAVKGVCIKSEVDDDTHFCAICNSAKTQEEKNERALYILEEKLKNIIAENEKLKEEMCRKTKESNEREFLRAITGKCHD